jgi:hypothetical protein
MFSCECSIICGHVDCMLIAYREGSKPSCRPEFVAWIYGFDNAASRSLHVAECLGVKVAQRLPLSLLRSGLASCSQSIWRGAV